MKKVNEQLFDKLNKLEFLNEKTNIVVTGATGIIGSNLLKVLISFREENNLNYELYALCRDEEKLIELVGSGVNYLYYDMTKKIEHSINSPIIIHTASPTSTQMFVNEPTKVHYILNESTKFIINFAKDNSAKKFIQLSTMEVYGEQKENIDIVETNNFGLDITNTRNCYPIAKMAAENNLLAAHKEFDIPVVILRLTQVMAPAIDKNDNRVVFQFARNIVNEENIVLRTTGQTYRSYIYIIDVITSILFAIDKCISGEVYNVSMPESCVSIVELAQKMIDLKNSDVDIEYNIESNDNTGYRDSLGLCISPQKIIDLGWEPIMTLDESLESMIESMEDLLN